MNSIIKMYEAALQVLSSRPAVMTIQIMLILTAAIGTMLILKQEAKANGLSGMTGAVSASTTSYWSKNKGRSAEGRRIRWTRILFILFIFEALLLYIVG